MFKTIFIFVLYMLLTLLYIPFTIINMIIVLIKYRNKPEDKTLNNYMLGEIKEIDIFAGNSFRTLFNILMLKKKPLDLSKPITEDVKPLSYHYKFGTHKRETISSVAGKNEKVNLLTRFGSFTSKICNLFESKHYFKAIDSHVRRGEIFCNCDNNIYKNKK